jgi:hypothetical protein
MEGFIRFYSWSSNRCDVMKSCISIFSMYSSPMIWVCLKIRYPSTPKSIGLSRSQLPIQSHLVRGNTGNTCHHGTLGVPNSFSSHINGY